MQCPEICPYLFPFWSSQPLTCFTNYNLHSTEICPHLFPFWSSGPRTCPLSNLLFTTSRLTNYRLHSPESCPHQFPFWSSQPLTCLTNYRLHSPEICAHLFPFWFSRPRTCPASCWWRPAPLPGSLWPQCPARKDRVEIFPFTNSKIRIRIQPMHAQCRSKSQILNNFSI